MDVVFLLIALLALTLVQSFLLRRFGFRGLDYRRFFSKDAVFEGDTLDLVEVIRNKKLLFLPWVRLESKMPPSFLFKTKEEMEISGDGERYHRSVFSFLPYSQVTRRHHITARKRGLYTLSHAAMTLGDLLGACLISRDIDAGARLYVYPRLLPDDAPGMPSSRWQGELLVKRWIVPDPFLVSGIRPYRAGDQARDVHWAASARMGQLQVKTRDFTASPKLLTIINCQLTEAQWGDLMEYEQAPIEYAISLAATVCVLALRGGVEAGFAANMPLLGDSACACLLPARSAERETELLSALASLKIKRQKSFPVFLSDLGNLSGMDILVFSAYDSPAIQERLAALRYMGNTVRMQVLGKEAAV